MSIKLGIYSFLSGLGKFLLLLYIGILSENILLNFQNIMNLIWNLLGVVVIYALNDLMVILLNKEIFHQQNQKTISQLNQQMETILQFNEINEDIYNDIQATDNPLEMNQNYFQSIALLIQETTFLIFISIYFLTIHPILFLCLIIFCIGYFYLLNHSKGFMNTYWKQYILNNRKRDIYNLILIDAKHALERKIFQVDEVITPYFQSEFKKANLANQQLARKRLKMDILLEIMLFLFFIIIAVISYRLKRLDIALLSFLLQLMLILNNTLLEIFYNSLQVMQYHEYLKSYQLLVNHIEQREQIPLYSADCILFQDMSFAYQKERYIFEHLNLMIPLHQNIGIVGINGIGKTTLLNLMAGLLLPSSGEIFIQQQHHPYNIHSLFSVVFQKCEKFPTSVLDNIIFDQNYDEKKLKRILEIVHLDSSLLNEVVMEGNENYRNVSGGEWQKIAIARGLYQDREVLLLDEPTSALNPIDEFEIINKLFQYRQNKTNVLVTHRCGLLRYCHLILVLNESGVCESGSFDELIRKEGVFFELFNTQRALYEES